MCDYTIDHEIQADHSWLWHILGDKKILATIRSDRMTALSLVEKLNDLGKCDQEGRLLDDTVKKYPPRRGKSYSEKTSADMLELA